jgi:hypothetical protein
MSTYEADSGLHFGRIRCEINTLSQQDRPSILFGIGYLQFCTASSELTPQTPLIPPMRCPSRLPDSCQLRLIQGQLLHNVQLVAGRNTNRFGPSMSLRIIRAHWAYSLCQDGAKRGSVGRSETAFCTMDGTCNNLLVSTPAEMT